MKVDDAVSWKQNLRCERTACERSEAGGRDNRRTEKAVIVGSGIDRSPRNPRPVGI